MRLGVTLRRQHIDRWFKVKWEVDSNKKILNTGAKAALQTKGVIVADPQEILDVEYRKKFKVHTIPDGGFDAEVIPQIPPRDRKHPNWHDKICYSYTNQTNLLGRLEQAQTLTHSLVFKNQLPLSDADCGDLAFEHNLAKEAVLYSNLLDAHQEVLPKRKDPNRLFWNYARDYGIPKSRANHNLIHQLLEICDKTFTFSKRQPLTRHVFPRIGVNASLNHGGDLLRFSVETSYLLTSEKPLQPIANEDQVSSSVQQNLPSIYPLKHTVALKQENIYELQDSLPLGDSECHPFVHTAFFFQEKIVDAVMEEGEAEAQALTQSFAICLAQAKKLYGDVERLPSPLTLNCVHTDGKSYLFGTFQLNNIKPDAKDRNSPKNLFWVQDSVPLFDVCEFQGGRPVLEGYNPVVFKQLLNIYASGL